MLESEFWFAYGRLRSLARHSLRTPGRAPRITAGLALLGGVCVLLLLPRPIGADAAASNEAPSARDRVEVVVEGVEGPARENVLAALTIHDRSGEELSATEIRRLHDGAVEEIRLALRPFGYYRAEVTAELEGEGEEWRASYRVDPGPPVRVEEVDIRIEGPGASEDELRRAVNGFPLAEGDPLDHPAYEAGRNRIEGTTSRLGYFDAAFDLREVRVDRIDNTARVLLHLRTGERYRFGEVRWEQEAYREELLDDFVPFERGVPFHGSQLLELQNALSGTGFFRGVDVDARQAEADGLEVPVVVTLVPMPRSTWRFGLGYGTDTGTRGTIGWELRRLNDRGHQLFGDLQASFIRRGIQFRYAIPFGGAGNDVSFSGGYRDDEVSTYRSRVFTLGTRLRQDRWGWRESLYLDLMRARYEVGGTEGLTTIVLPGAEWSRTRSDDPIHPTRGYRVDLETRGSARAIGSQVSFLQGTVRARLVRPVGAAGRVLLRADLGSTETARFDELPSTFRYFAGGDRSVRGFGYFALGPLDEEGEPLGGRHLVVGSVEYDVLLWGDWGAAVFWDLGNALRGFEDRLEQGAGIGARWLSPVGMVRVDLATAVSRSGTPLRLHVTVGPDL